MRLLAAATAVLAFASPARAAAEADVVTSAAPSADEAAHTRDAMLLESAALPRRGTFRVHGAFVGATGMSAAQTTLGAAVAPRVFIAASARGENLRFAPAASLRVQVLEGIADVTIGAGVRAWSAMEDAGSQTELRLAVGRRFGVMSLALNTAIAQGFAGRSDTDFEGSALMSVAVTESLRVGGEGRVRFELVDRDIPNEGREVEATAGATAYLVFPRWQLQALAGYAAPRGFLRPSPAGGVAAIFEL